jgi:hypothetical protein
VSKHTTAECINIYGLVSISVLNVAGPRASGEPRVYDYTKGVIQQALNGD